MSWANTVLQETGQTIQEISDIQHGCVLCQLIDSLDNTASLQQNVQVIFSLKYRIIIVGLLVFINASVC